MQTTALLFGAFSAAVEFHSVIIALIEVNKAIIGCPCYTFANKSFFV